MRRASLIALISVLSVTFVRPAPAGAATEWVKVADDFVVPASVIAANPTAAAAPGDGFALFPGFVGVRATYTIRLIVHPSIETLRPYVQAAAADASNASGATLTVASGTRLNATPGAGEITVQISSNSPCGSGVAGCGGPNPGGSQPYWYSASGQVWIYPVALTYSAAQLNHLVRHELGHAVAMAHYDAQWNSQYQVMHSSRYDATTYRSGDRNGLDYLGDNGFRSNPFGSLDTVSAFQDGLLLRGWAIDPNTSASIQVQVSVDGRVTTITANRIRTDVGDAYPAFGDAHGYDIFVPAPPGTRSGCVTALNTRQGSANTSLGCKSATIAAGAYFADVTGPEGLLGTVTRADAVVVGNSSVTTRRSSGSAFGANETWSATAYFGGVLTAFADVTGDRKGDGIAVNAGGITVRRSTGSVFGPNEPWTTNAFYGGLGTEFADVTGDGRADAVVVNGTGITVRRSTGTAFSSTYETWATGAAFGDRKTTFADVNGDDRADAVLFGNDNVRVMLSTGSTFGPASVWISIAYHGNKGTFLADVSGDGLADAIVVNTGAITVRRSNGVSFGAPEAWTTNAYYGNRGTHFADVTGDGVADAIVVNDGGMTVRRSTGSAFNSTYEAWTSNSYYGTH